MFAYSFDMGWEKTDFSIDDYSSNNDIEKSFISAGFNKVSHVPEGLEDSFFSTEVYAFNGSNVGKGHSYNYIVSLSVGQNVEDIMIPDLPSLIELMAKLTSVNMSTLFREREGQRFQEEFTGSAKPSSW